MAVSYSFVHNRKKKLDESGEAIIEMVCTLNRKRKYVSCKLRIKPKHWNQEKREVRRSHPKYEHYNSVLKELEATYYKFEADLVYKFRRQTREFHLSDFDALKSREKNQSTCFVSYVDKEIQNRTKSKDFKEHTLKGYGTFLNNLKEFKSYIPFSTIDRELGKAIRQYLASRYDKQGSRWRFEKDFKTFLNAAHKDHYVDQLQVEEIRSVLNTPKVQKRNPARVTLKEFKKILQWEPKTTKQQAAYDAFLIGCYTGLRISDVLNIGYEEIEYDEEGNLRLRIQVIKGQKLKKKDSLVCPIHKLFKFSENEYSEPVKIIKKYEALKNDLRKRPKADRLFFQVSQAFTNRYLKDIAQELDIEIKGLKFKHSRDIFARLLHHYFGHSITLVKELLQHSDISVTMVYETSNEKEREQLLENTNWDLLNS